MEASAFEILKGDPYISRVDRQVVSKTNRERSGYAAFRTAKEKCRLQPGFYRRFRPMYITIVASTAERLCRCVYCSGESDLPDDGHKE